MRRVFRTVFFSSGLTFFIEMNVCATNSLLNKGRHGLLKDAKFGSKLML